ncbi:MAG: gamma carbonic anhydrase family protein [Saprospirales bacterium]|nr:MAG: gamma carbonic anhydrase family protein [Saprospirales bacterium]
MAIIKKVRGITPVFGNQCFLAETAVLTGDVTLGDECSIWFNAVVRGDVNAVRIGNRVNIQDNATVHCTYEKFGTSIGDNVSIGHNAIIHGCTLHDNTIVGMGAMVLDGAEIPSFTMIAAGALIPEGRVLESGYLYMGMPAKKVKPLSEEQIDFFIKRTSKNYVKYASWYK